MRFLFVGLMALLMVLGLVAGALLWLGLDAAPQVPPTAQVSVADIDRAMRLLQHNDPRGKLPGITRAVMLSQRDLELLAHQAGRRWGDVRTRVRLQPGVARLQFSLHLPDNPAGAWLNVDAVLHQTRGLPEVDRLHIGRVHVPGWLAEAALPRLLAALNLRAQGELAQRIVSQVNFGPQHVVLAYAWPDNAQQDLTDSALSPEDQARLKVYVDRLATLAAELGTSTPVSMARLLPPVFTLARQRSTDAASAQRENRAALVALALAVVNGQGLPALLPATLAPAQPAPRARAMRPLRVLLHGRPDTPQHYLVSAALAAEGGGPLSDAIGLYKEVSDSRGGSGFSFNDLAADHAGTRLGLLAVKQPQALQARLAAGVQEADLLPPIADLPENMPAAEFQRRFGGTEGVAYKQMLRDIETRLDRLPLLSPAP